MKHERTLQRLRHLGRVNGATQNQWQGYNLQVLARQKYTRFGYEGRVAAELHAVFGGTEHGGAQALAGRQQRPGQHTLVKPGADRFSEQLSQIAEVARLAAIDVLADAAREHDAAKFFQRRQRVGQQQVVQVDFRKLLLQDAQQRVGHGLGHMRQVVPAHNAAELPVKAGAQRMASPGRVKTGDAAAIVDHQQAAAKVHRCGRTQLAVFDQTELGCPAANVDIQYARRFVIRAARRTRAVNSQHALHVVPCCCADELAALLGQHRRNGLTVFTTQRLAGQDHRAGIDVVGMHTGCRVGALDDFAQRMGIDERVTLVRRQRVRRLVNRLARDHHITCRQLVGDALQVNFRKDHLSAGRANVDAYAVQDDVVLHPQRVVGRVRCAIEVVVVVVAALAMIVAVLEIRSQLMVFQGVRRTIQR